MKAVTRYVSTDGSQWDSEADALRRDELDGAVRLIELQLPAVPESSSARVQVSQEFALAAKTRVVNLCRQEFPDQPIFMNRPEDIHPFSYAGRFLDDVGGPLRRVWSWFMCYSDGYLYQQPFYALNPHQFKGGA